MRPRKNRSGVGSTGDGIGSRIELIGTSHSIAMKAAMSHGSNRVVNGQRSSRSSSAGASASSGSGSRPRFFAGDDGMAVAAFTTPGDRRR